MSWMTGKAVHCTCCKWQLRCQGRPGEDGGLVLVHAGKPIQVGAHVQQVQGCVVRDERCAGILRVGGGGASAGPGGPGLLRGHRPGELRGRPGRRPEGPRAPGAEAGGGEEVREAAAHRAAVAERLGVPSCGDRLPGAAEINERKVSSFDLANRKAWMPTPPKYAPYCALKDSSRWDSEATMEDQDGGQPLGSLKRADAGQFSEEKNWQFVEPLADAQNHPCHPFYYAKSSLDRGAWESSFDMSRLLSFQGIDVKKFLHEPVQRGATFAATKACRKRQSQRRNTDHAKNLGFGHLRDLTMGAVSYVTDSICSVIPGAGTLLAPMGLGVELSFDFSDICSGINSLVHETYQQVSSRQMLAREAWKDENDNIDSQFCSFVDNQDMYQTFCNLHCVEDAVVKGNFAVLKSMKGLDEKYLIETVHSMLLHYAKQSSEHLAAIQQQINTNSANMMDGLESFLTTYFTQGFDQATTYRNDLSTQITETS
ncbi:unnamed protein product [Effrenium voratum]|nr:unnamed protein product [Effrenium voratum]